MSYIQLACQERVTLSSLCQQGLSIRVIARILKRHHLTLYREFDRNYCHITDGAYRRSEAHRRTRARRSRSRRQRRCTAMGFL